MTQAESEDRSVCGIVGSFGPAGNATDWLHEACASLRHRGPDSRGVWMEPAAGVALGHVRLAIQDLTTAGHQPMASACGRYQCVFNGEIYNHLELRRGLGARSWRGHSDTETVVECLAAWGVDKTLRSLVGMFAFAVFDAAERRLIVGRDRLGEKPLYYGYAGRAFVFASELAALRLAPNFDGSLDRKALASYMQSSYVPAPYSIYASMRKLPAASWFAVTAKCVAGRELPQPVAYWSAVDVAINSQRERLDIDDNTAVAMLDRVLGDAVVGQTLSDVPVGSFLSGGIDSSTITALMQARSPTRVRTFSIGFRESEYDESNQARAIARYLGTDHTELRVGVDDALGLVPKIPVIYSEPFADSSQLPTLLLAQLARRHVTVALSGDGGDEVFGGYKRYALGSRVWSWLARIPFSVRRALAASVRSLSPETWDGVAAVVRPVMPSRYQLQMLGDKIHKGADVLECPDGYEAYERLVNQWWSGSLVIDAGSPVQERPDWLPKLPDFIHRGMLLDATTYLPDDILVKVDRAAMAVSLETRVPILDHRVFELAWRLPLRMKVRGGETKWILRQLLRRYVPQDLIERPKMGFAVPLDAWLRGGLREWAEHLLDESRLRREGYLNVDVVRRGWDEHLAGHRNWRQQLWNVLMFQAWLETGA